MDTSDPAAAARALVAGVAGVYRINLPRDWRRRATPARSARPRDVTIAAIDDGQHPPGVWLDVSGRAGVLFSEDEWAQFALEAVALMVERELTQEPGE